ncbi:MAG: PTS sugar transporter subunit IIB [Deferrisomatales bacterium]|nr:PTS sugar transporter subunit IIB [Deferrisomatales bacterium]
MAVVLARVDSRLVHGQVLEAWVPALGVDTILVVDPELGGDPLQRMVLEGLSSRGLHIQIAPPREAAELLTGALRDTRVMVLFRGLREAVAARAAGVPFEVLNLGNLHPSQDSSSLTVSVYLTAEDERMLRELAECGLALEARAVPADRGPDVNRWLGERARC